jgi:Caspase domain
MAADDHAVVVGITRYPSLESLGGPEYDATEFAAWLEDPGGGAVPAAQVKRILSSCFPAAADPAEPTTAKVEQEFDRLHQLGVDGGGRAGRRLYIYFAGHGFAPSLEDAALLMANAARGRTGHHIPGRPYANWFRKASFFDEVVLIMDCCRENYPRAPIRVPPYDPLTGARLASHFYGFATEWSRAAREAPLGPGGQMRGLFTVSLIAALRNATPDAAGNVTGESLERFIYNYLRTLVGTAELQDPVFDYAKPNPIVFATRAAGTTLVRVTLSAAHAGKPVELLDGALRLVSGGTVSAAGAFEWRVPAGLYKARVVGGPDKIVEIVNAGGTTDVAF